MLRYDSSMPNSTREPGYAAAASRASRSSIASFSFSPARDEVAHQQPHRRALDAGLDHVRVHEAVVAVRRFRRQRVVRQASR